METSKLEFRLKTRTPLWLGGIDRDSAIPKESGMLGSLRFWYEGILRQYGIEACDPTEHRCGYCEACQLFGSTIAARRFRIEIEGLRPVPVFFRVSRKVAVSSGNWLWNIFGGRETGGEKDQNVYRFGVHALWAPDGFRMSVSPRGRDTKDTLSLLAFTLFSATLNGGLGAKTQHGFGQMSLLPDDRVPFREMFQNAQRYLVERAASASKRASAPAEKFTLATDRFFRHVYTIPTPPAGLVDIGTPPGNHAEEYIPCAFDIRYKYESYNPSSQVGVDRGLRPAIEAHFDRPFARLVFGYVEGGDARASRIHVSHLYRDGSKGPYSLKIWGDVDRKDEVEKVVKEHIFSRFTDAVLVFPKEGQ